MDMDDEEFLVKFGTREGIVDRDIGKRWFDAVRSSDFITMKDLLPICDDLISYRGTGTSYGFIGSTAVHWAAARGSLPILTWLAENGANLDTQNNGGSAPLHSAASNGQIQTLTFLLRHGANSALVDCCGDTPEEVAQPGLEVEIGKVIRMTGIELTLRKTSPSQWTVAQMKQALKYANINTSQFTEKSEIVAAVEELIASVPAPETYKPVSSNQRDEEEIQEDADAATAAKEKGNTSYRNGDMKSAIKWYTIAMRFDPSNKALPSNRAAAYMSTERFDLALSDSKKSIELDPEWPKGHYRKGCALLQLGRSMDALWAFNTAFKLSDPPSDEILQALTHTKELVTQQPNTELDPESDYEDEYEDDEEIEPEEDSSYSEPPRVVPKHDWFDCVLCDNRTRDYATTPCCEKGLCGTCLKRSGNKCLFSCT